MMRIALEERIIEHVPRVKLYKPQNKRRRVATADEYTKLLAAATPHLQRIICCCFETGMRSGEIKGLTWAKIDWDEGFIHLAAEDTKERKPKKIPISSRQASSMR
jgi:integrase